jgi:nucleoid-associated protein YgaU
MNCPICKKAGLSDDTKVCPQCDTNLVGFDLISKIARNQENLISEKEKTAKEFKYLKAKNKYSLLFSLMLILIIIGISFFYISNISNSNLVVTLKQNLLTNLVKVKQLENENKQLKMNVKTYKYVVKKGDNLIKISRIFYGSGTNYYNIIKDNNLQPNFKLFVGDTLIIKLKN